MEQRVDWIDYAKGIGIILVVYGHVARGLYNANFQMDERLYTLVDSLIYSFHMPLYFAIAGWFFLEEVKRKGALNQVISKVNTVLYLFLLWSVLHGLVEVALSKFTTNQLTIGELLDLSNHPRNHLWFLFALFFVSVICSFIYAFAERHWHAAILLVGALMYWVRHNFDISVTPFDYYIMGFCVFLMFGVSLARWFEKVPNETWLVALSLLLFGGVQYIYHWVLGWTWLEGPIIARLGLALFSIYVVLLFSRWLGRFEIGFLGFLGRHSLEIYLMHLIAGSGVRIILQKFAGIEDVTLHLVLGTLFGIILPVVGAWFIYTFKLGFLFRVPKWLRIPPVTGGAKA